MKVDWYLPNPRECLGGAGFDLALVRNGIVQRVRPDGLIRRLGADRAVPQEVGVYESLQKYIHY